MNSGQNNGCDYCLFTGEDKHQHVGKFCVCVPSYATKTAPFERQILLRQPWPLREWRCDTPLAGRCSVILERYPKRGRWWRGLDVLVVGRGTTTSLGKIQSQSSSSRANLGPNLRCPEKRQKHTGSLGQQAEGTNKTEIRKEARGSHGSGLLSVARPQWQ